MTCKTAFAVAIASLVALGGTAVAAPRDHAPTRPSSGTWNRAYDQAARLEGSGSGRQHSAMGPTFQAWGSNFTRPGVSSWRPGPAPSRSRGSL